MEETKTNEGKAAEMEHAIRHEIKVKIEENPVYYSSLKEKLEELIQARKSKQMDIIDLVEALREKVNDMRNTSQKSEEHGMTREQYPFYQMVEKELGEEDQNALKDLTHIQTEMIQDQAVIEWTEKEDVKREMRKRIKHQLRSSKINKDKIEALAQRLMDLAAVHYKK
ncbi:DUF3387 domain-containing protein [Anaerobacillus alkaliphilus]|uniref:DUF3387 domain-containing protein n=2 Tax=Anaerobacillus alkaliphilus TaxID=1548597 RepID=A0A4Q0VN85_9BACI|nr:DUF3387 domain-containing protein [Anaerobacillus alkaliphilus]